MESDKAYKLSTKAREDLKKVLAKDIGPDRAAQFKEEDLDGLGHRLLRLTALVLKRNETKGV